MSWLGMIGGSRAELEIKDSAFSKEIFVQPINHSVAPRSLDLRDFVMIQSSLKKNLVLVGPVCDSGLLCSVSGHNVSTLENDGPETNKGVCTNMVSKVGGSYHFVWVVCDKGPPRLLSP